MARVLRYLTHPQVVIDPATEVTRWCLSDIGRARVAGLAVSGALAGTETVVSSVETKAVETATPLAEALGVGLVIRDDMHENDRSATGFLPPAAFEAAADRFFAAPDASFRGWETAREAQGRIVAAVDAVLAENPAGDVLIVGHGAVGSLLYCHLAGVPISRVYDQPAGGGCYFAFREDRRRPDGGWRPMEALAG